MPTAEAQIPTERSSRYLVQLCRHASRMGGHLTRDPQAHQQMPRNVTVEWSDTNGTVSTDGGTCTLHATADALILRIDADNHDTLHRMQDLVTQNLIRFSRRDPLTVNWAQPDDNHAPAPAHPTAPRRRHRTIALVVLAVLAVTAHLVLGGAVLAAPQWTGWAADAILAAVLVKTAAIGLGYLAHHRRKANRSRSVSPSSPGHPLR